MGKAKKAQQVKIERDPNPLGSAIALFEFYKKEYGSNILLDQSVRVVKAHLSGNDDISFEFACQALNDSEIIENAALAVAREESKKSLRDIAQSKANLIYMIRSKLLNALC